MKDVMKVLRLKEQELQQVQREVEALRLIAPLLSTDDERRAEPAVIPSSANPYLS